MHHLGTRDAADVGIGARKVVGDDRKRRRDCMAGVSVHCGGEGRRADGAKLGRRARRPEGVAWVDKESAAEDGGGEEHEGIDE